jgi:hypothetical protein
MAHTCLLCNEAVYHCTRNRPRPAHIVKQLCQQPPMFLHTHPRPRTWRQALFTATTARIPNLAAVTSLYLHTPTSNLRLQYVSNYHHLFIHFTNEIAFAFLKPFMHTSRPPTSSVFIALNLRNCSLLHFPHSPLTFPISAHNIPLAVLLLGSFNWPVTNDLFLRSTARWRRVEKQ